MTTDHAAALAEALEPFAELADEVRAVAAHCRTTEECVFKACQWEHLSAATEALAQYDAAKGEG